MITNIEIKITAQGHIPEAVKQVIGDMIHDYLIEQGIFLPEPTQIDLFD